MEITCIFELLVVLNLDFKPIRAKILGPPHAYQIHVKSPWEGGHGFMQTLFSCEKYNLHNLLLF